MSAKQLFKPEFQFGLGGVPIGNEFEIVTDEAALNTLEAAWNAGVRYFDVSPWYGLGLAERRYGMFLHNQPRESYLISTKVGKLLKAAPRNNSKELFPYGNSPNNVVFDYTADGVRRSIEDSLQRLGIDHIDVVFVHDLSPDNLLLPTPWPEQFVIALNGAFPALSRMRDEGIIRGWGVGVNTPEPILRVMQESDPEVCLLASQYSLIDHADALNRVFPVARRQGVSFVVGSSLNAGFISGSPRYNYGKESWNISQEHLAKRERLRAVANQFGVDRRTSVLGSARRRRLTARRSAYRGSGARERSFDEGHDPSGILGRTQAAAADRAQRTGSSGWELAPKPKAGRFNPAADVHNS
jgi:D-threo-aldose 1-dehydrogenase